MHALVKPLEILSVPFPYDVQYELRTDGRARSQINMLTWNSDAHMQKKNEDISRMEPRSTLAFNNNRKQTEGAF